MTLLITLMYMCASRYMWLAKQLLQNSLQQAIGVAVSEYITTHYSGTSE